MTPVAKATKMPKITTHTINKRIAPLCSDKNFTSFQGPFQGTKKEHNLLAMFSSQFTDLDLLFFAVFDKNLDRLLYNRTRSLQAVLL